MRKNLPTSAAFYDLFVAFLPPSVARSFFALTNAGRRRPPKLPAFELIMSLVYHAVAGAGTLAQHVRDLTQVSLSESALSQRRTALPWVIFEMILETVLAPKAKPQSHPEAFYHGLRLCGLDGTQFSVANTRQIKGRMRKAKSRRHRAAFAKLGAVGLVELGLRNPIGAAVGFRGESEMVLARQLLDRLPQKSLLICDRYYGVPLLLLDFREVHGEFSLREFLVRVKSKLSRKILEVYRDGSALVEIRRGKRTMLVREIAGRVRRQQGDWKNVRLWTSLLDWKKHPANALMELYARRWEQETFYRELKVDLRSHPLLRSHTAETAGQEIAALFLAYALLVDERVKAADQGEVSVLQISFVKTLQMVRGLWQLLELTKGLLDARGVKRLVARALKQLARKAIGRRRKRSCPRKVRQPVSSWPRLTRNTSLKGPPICEVRKIRG